MAAERPGDIGGTSLPFTLEAQAGVGGAGRGMRTNGLEITILHDTKSTLVLKYNFLKYCIMT